ncbi:hypothetical protein MBLNU457_g2973t1 [Dothideomycetes sp. NU457]
MASLTDDSRVTQTGSHTYTADFPLHWCIGAVPHGGFVTTCFLRVASLHFNTTLSRQNQPDTTTLHLTFIRRTAVGPAEFTVTDTKLGRGTSTIHITLRQNNSDLVVGYLTHTNLLTASGVSFSTSWALSPPTPNVSLSALAGGKDEHWALRKAMPFASFRRASNHLAFHFPRKGQADASIADQWIRFRNPAQRFTNTSLGYVVDMFPQVMEVMPTWPHDQYSVATEEAQEGMSADAISREEKKSSSAQWWYPTVLLNLDVKKKLPDEGLEWLFVRTRPKVVKDGRFDLEVIVMDEAGEVVALSHHVCMILSAGRNLAGRGEKKGTKSKM